MPLHACRCGHPGEQHYTVGMARRGGCKQRGCSCKAFEETSA